MAITHKGLTVDGSPSDKKTVVLDNDQGQCLALCDLMEDRGYQTVPVYSLSGLNLFLQKKNCLVVLIDLDTVPLDNRMIQVLTQKNPGVYFLCLSSKRFHPELKDAICYHIYACINKQVDPDELFYWLRSIYEDEADPKKQLDA